MAYRVRVYPIGRRLGPESQSQVFETATEAEAVTLGAAQLNATPRNGEPFVFEIFDPSDRLVLSYTSEISLPPAPIEKGPHPGQP